VLVVATVAATDFAVGRRAAGLSSGAVAWCRSSTTRGRGGARLLATDRESEDSPIRCPASRLADQATAAVATIPSSAAAPQIVVRWIICAKR
jgi:hypothetical protein